MNQDKIERAKKIAEKSVRSNIVSVEDSSDPSGEKKYLLAGANQYRTLWARDLSMSVAGALYIGEFKAVRDSLEAFFKLQREDGLFPRVVDHWNIYLRVISGVMGKALSYRHPLQGWFETENRVISIDGNLMIPWAASEYVKKTQDEEFARKWFPAVQLSLNYIEKSFGVQGLIGKQPPFADWADSVRRIGRVAFTNEFFILALRGASEWADFLNKSDQAELYWSRSDEVAAAFLRFFWNPEKKCLRNFESDDHLSADANLMAVANRILPHSLAIEVMENLRKTPLWMPMPGRPTWPDYPASMKSWAVKRVNLSGYHDSIYWLWITALAASAEMEVGNLHGYHKILTLLSSQITSDGAIHEVYDLSKDGRHLTPLRRTFYQAEVPFTWSAAFFLQVVGSERGL
jgi:glycogen debranching enzyme